jgi:hypothetical protein
MERREQNGPEEGDLPNAAGNRLIRRARHFTPPGSAFPRRKLFSPAYLRDISRVELGDLVAELTPRQAVVWLANLDAMVSLYESSTDRKLDAGARARLQEALRGIVRNHGRKD